MIFNMGFSTDDRLSLFNLEPRKRYCNQFDEAVLSKGSSIQGNNRTNDTFL